MDKITLKNMTLGKLYEFAPKRYIWQIEMAGGTRGGNYRTDGSEPSVYTEIFRLGNSNELECIWSGLLIENEFSGKVLDHQGCFSVFSYDLDAPRRFKQEHDLELAPEELQQAALRDVQQVMASRGR